MDIDVNFLRATAVACSAFVGIALLSPRPAWRPLRLGQPDLVGQSSAALQPHLLLGGVAAHIAWRFALRMLWLCFRVLRLRSVTNVSSKNRAPKLGEVEAKTRDKRRAKLVQEQRPRFHNTPMPLALAESSAAIFSWQRAATSGAQGREGPSGVKAVKRLCRRPRVPRLSASSSGSGTHRNRHKGDRGKIDFDLKIVPEKLLANTEKDPPEKILGSAKMAEKSCATISVELDTSPSERLTPAVACSCSRP